MISIFAYQDYRKFTRESFKELEGGDYGKASKLARHMGVHSTFVSQFINNQKTISPEQGFKICTFLNLNQNETEYFLTMVQIERADVQEYKAHLTTKLMTLRENAQKLANRVSYEKQLSVEEQATFYSDWTYLACRLCVGLGKNTIKSMGKYLGITEGQVEQVTGFLVRAGFLKHLEGKFSRIKQSTHLSSDSPWVKTHHRNWRMRAIEKVGQSTSNMHYSAPMTISRADFYKIKELLIKTITEVDAIMEPSESETLVCLNIDWFHVTDGDD